MKNLFKNFLFIFLALLIIATLVSSFELSKNKTEEADITKMISEINNENVENISLHNNYVVLDLKGTDSADLKIKLLANQSFYELIASYNLDKNKIDKINISVKEESGFSFWLSLIVPWIMPLLLFIFLIYFFSRQVQGANNKAMGFGKTNAKISKPDDKNKKTFKDVAGAKEAKEELLEIVDFLKDPKKFSNMGAKIPKGVLLMGAPGTGKTLLAKAVAGEAGVPFFHISGSEFVEMFVGVGASRVRDLFDNAKKSTPAIVFIDEIDAVGRKRGSGLGGSHDEREQTLNQILVEMDGFEPNLGVIVVAATNRPDVLDPALLRPGRFDRRIVIDMPDLEDRLEILEVHAKNKPLEKKISIRKIAERTPGFSGAELENLLNEAAILAVRKNKKIIEENDVFEAIEKVILGPEKKSKIMTEKEKEMTAYHEAGHAIVGHFLPNCHPIRKVSIIGRGLAGGYTLSTPEKDVLYKTYAQFEDDLAMILGGYVTEKMIYGKENLSTGPSSDLKKATQIAKTMVLKYGMSDKLGPRQYSENEELIFLAQEIHEKTNYSEKTAEIIDGEINSLLKNAENRAEKLIKEKRSQMDNLVKHLIEKETVEQKEFEEIMDFKN
ncbi:MAG: ATP-dependent zinc metalloprotease FtsH [Patescibacteria group bacterium]